MKVELQISDTIAIPEGCKAIVKDGSVVFEREQKFKDGDVLVSNNKYERFPFIFKGDDNKGFHKFYVRLGYCGHLIICKEDVERCGNSELSLATEEEKQLLFDKMKEQGLRWNAEEKRIENIRWHPVIGELYYFVCMDIHVSRATYQKRCFDRDKIAAGNCFCTNDQAEEAARRIKETLRKYHEEIGE